MISLLVRYATGNFKVDVALAHVDGCFLGQALSREWGQQAQKVSPNLMVYGSPIYPFPLQLYYFFLIHFLMFLIYDQHGLGVCHI